MLTSQSTKLDDYYWYNKIIYDIHIIYLNYPSSSYGADEWCPCGHFLNDSLCPVPHEMRQNSTYISQVESRSARVLYI